MQKSFVSYAREDEPIVRDLSRDLRSAGAEIWVDQLDIPAGTRWDRAVEKALKECPSVIVILTPISVDSDNVMDEVSYALEERKRLIPVLCQDCDIPFRLRRLQYIDMRTDYQEGLKQLVRTLELGETPKRPLPVPQQSSSPHLDDTPRPVRADRAPKAGRVLGALAGLAAGAVVGLLTGFIAGGTPLAVSVTAAFGILIGAICGTDPRARVRAGVGAVVVGGAWLLVDGSMEQNSTHAVARAMVFGAPLGGLLGAISAWLGRKRHSR